MSRKVLRPTAASRKLLISRKLSMLPKNELKRVHEEYIERYYIEKTKTKEEIYV